MTHTELLKVELSAHGATKELLHQVLEYRNGFLYWKIALSTKTKIGSVAGCVSSDGYTKIGLNKKTYQAHRLIWIMHHGQAPSVIDHINGNPLDNRIENLRSATIAENVRNSRLSRNNKSGAKGVFWCNTYRLWAGRVIMNRRSYHAGRYESREDCIKAVTKLRANLHGEFARQEVLPHI